MPPLRASDNITSVRKDIKDHFDDPGITPVTRNDRFAGIIISTGELDEATAARLSKKLKFNQKAAVDELLNIALDD